MGKSSTAYLLNQAALGGIVSTPPQISACGSDADGGDAITGTVVYVPCGNGVQAMQTSPLGTRVADLVGRRTAPRSRPAGSCGPSAGPSLYGLNPANGATV